MSDPLNSNYFKKGADVEISSSDDGFRGAWYSGTVIKSKNSNNKRMILVEYKTLMADESGTKPLRETLDVVQLRPLQPREKRDMDFRFSDEVDAYYNDGWWEGVVTGVNPGDRYSVFFRATREQLEFSRSELRLHREWVYGKWVPPLEQQEEEVPMVDQEQPQQNIPPQEEFIDEEADNALVPPAHGIEIEANNHQLDVVEFRPQLRVVVDILLGHPLREALTATTDVPVLYVYQVWLSAQVVTALNTQTITARIDNHSFTLTLDSFRRLLSLPEATAGGHAAYDPAVNDATLCAEIRALGYNHALDRPSAFNRKYLAPILYTLFTILNRCLSSRWKGIDQCTGDFLRLFHAVCYNRHIDFALIIWRELVQAIRQIGGTKQKKFLPYPRFLSLAVRQHMDTNLNILRRMYHPVCPSFHLRYLVIRNPSNAQPMPLPEALLAHADPNAPSVIAYREALGLGASVVQPKPEGPPQGARPERREGLRTRGGRVRVAGAPGRGVLIIHHGRGTGASGALDTHASTTHSSRPGTSQQPRIHTLRTTTEAGPSTSLHEVPIVTETERPMLHRDPEVDTSEPPSPPRQSEAVESESTESDMDRAIRLSLIPHRIGAQPSLTEGSPSDSPTPPIIPTSQPITGDTRREEGELVENLEQASRREWISKKNHERSSIRSREARERIQTSVSQVATSAISSHPLGRCIEEAAVDLAAQSHTLPSHSPISQQMGVSLSHGDLAHNLPFSHSESLGIETRDQPPPVLTSFDARSSLEPLDFIIPSARTHNETTTIGALSDPIGTSVVSLPLSGMRAEGNPTTATPLPSVNVGGTTSTVDTSTGNLSDPGVTLPDILSREYLDGALKAVREALEQQFTTELDKVRSLIKGKEKIVETETATTPPPAPVQPTYSVDTLKTMLLAQLLQHTDTNASTEADLISVLISVLRSQVFAPPSSMISRLNQLDSTLKDVQKVVNLLFERVASLEDTCKSQAGGLQRRHDDQDHREGENKRQRLSESEPILTETITTVQSDPCDSTPSSSDFDERN